MTEALLRLPTVMELTGLSRSAIYQRVKERTFPAPVSLGARAVAWPEAEVDRWIREKIAESRGQAA